MEIEMHPVSPAGFNLLEAESNLNDSAELSMRAWEQSVSCLPEEGIGQTSLNFPALRISVLPGWECLSCYATENWVSHYEAQLAILQKQKRKQGKNQNGVFYTPKSVARYLTQRTLGVLVEKSLSEIEHRMSVQQEAQARQCLDSILQWQIVDPSCGTGIFLVESLQCLIAAYQQIQRQFPELLNELPLHHILAHQLQGIDLDPVGVMISECRLVHMAAQYGPLPPAVRVPGLRCANTLQDDLNCETGAQWDVILGNPPYVSEVRRQSQRFQALQQSKGAYYSAKMDLCDAFIDWAIRRLKRGGQLAYILPEYWTQRSSTAQLRKRLWEEGRILEFWAFQDAVLFSHAPGHHSSFLIWQKKASSTQTQADTQFTQPHVEKINWKNSAAENRLEFQTVWMGQGRQVEDLSETHLEPAIFSLEAGSHKLIYGPAAEMTLLAKLAACTPLLKSEQIQQGLVIPQGRLKKADYARLPMEVQQALPENAGVFLLTESEVQALNWTEPELVLLKPYYMPAGFQPFQGFLNKTPPYLIIYVDQSVRREIEADSQRYARLRAHLEQFLAINTSAFAPYGLHRARQPVWFEDRQKILCPRQVAYPAFATVPFPAYVNEGFYSIRADEEADYYCAVLNSRLAWFWFYKHKRKGHRLQIDKDVLCLFPKPSLVPDSTRQQLMILARQLAVPGADNQLLQAKLNQLVCQLYQLTDEEIACVEAAWQAIQAPK